MFNERKPIPFFLNGPDKSRCYAYDHKRWTVVLGTVNDDFVAKLVLKQGWGWAETITAIAIPFVTFALFGTICLAISYFDPAEQFAGEFFIAIMCISFSMLILWIGFLWLEIRYFNHLPRVTLTVYDNQKFSLGNDETCFELTNGSIFQYTLHHPAPGTQGGGTTSELNLVVRDGDEVKATHKLMAHQSNWCWRHAQSLSKATGLPIERIALQSNGKRFPPGLRS